VGSAGAGSGGAAGNAGRKGSVVEAQEVWGFPAPLSAHALAGLAQSAAPTGNRAPPIAPAGPPSRANHNHVSTPTVHKSGSFDA
jgi:hypothetical protein